MRSPVIRQGRKGFVERRSATLYLVTGVTGFVVDFGLLVFFREVGGTPVWLATSAGFWVGLAVVFLVNKYVTFGVRHQGHVQLLRYLVLLGVNWLLTLAFVGLAVHVGVGYQFGKIIAVTAMTMWNYPAYRLWVFR